MSKWTVYSKDGLTERCEVKKLEYSGEFLGACSLTVSVCSPTPVAFELGDYLMYRGERFEMNYDPTVVKQSSVETDGEGFVYDNVIFNSLSDELTRCEFLDYVPSDNEIHYTSLPTFSFFADSISKLAERIQVNLDRIYTGEKKWTVVVHPEYVNTMNVNIQVNNNTVWDALGFVNSKFGASFIIRNRTITIGTTGVAVGNVFSYGKGNGLYKIERNAESEQKIITRLRAYGSTRNLPTNYYANVEGGNVPNNMAVRNLMLPSFPTETHDPYIDSDNVEELGIREGTVFFDGSGDLEEIYPTMEGMTAEDLAEAGIQVDATGELDVVVEAEQISDDGVFAPAEGEEEVSIPTFTITLKDVGFDINDYLTTSSATISMQDGMCGGREFEIVECVRNGSYYVLTCNRHHDESLDLYFPYNDYQIKSGDKFVLLNIEMPDVYIKAASERLLTAAKAYLAKNDYVRYSYVLTVDNVFMARQHDEAVANDLTSIHDTIKEGDIMLFQDDDLGINGGVTIASLSIKENADESIIPEYEITLKDEKTVGSLEKIQNQINSILVGGAGSGGELNTAQLESLIAAYGDKLFLRKDKADRTAYSLGVGGTLTVDKGAVIRGTTETDDVVVNDSIHSKEFVSGFTGGKGWAIRMKEYLNSAGVAENRSVAEVDDLIVRGALRVFEFVVSQMLGENDNRTFTGMMEVDHYDPATGKVWLDTRDGKLYNTFRKDDIILVQQYNGMPSEDNDYYITKQYELIIDEVGVGDTSLGEDRLDWVTFRNFSTPMEGGGVSLITEGDTFVRIDNLTDPNRKGIVQIMTVGEDTPYMDVIYGKKTDPDNAPKSRFGNLEGVYNRLFGWLQDFGAYIANLYAVGEFRIAHTGEDVADRVEMLRGSFRTSFSQTYFDMKDEDNYLRNGKFTGGLEGWELGESGMEFIVVDGVPIFANRNLMSSNPKYAGGAVYNDKDMLRILNSDVKQANADIRKPGTHKEYIAMDGSEEEPSYEYKEVKDKLYLYMRVYCDGDGTLEVGFDGAGVEDDSLPFVTEELTKGVDEIQIKAEGTWDGKGDFVIRCTGDVYIEFVALTDEPLENLMVSTKTWMEQDAGRIALLGQKIDKNSGAVTDLGIELDAANERIQLYVKKTDGLESSYAQLRIDVDGLSSTVSSVQGSVADAEELARAAEDAANQAAKDADDAWWEAYYANEAAKNAQDSADSAQDSADSAQDRADSAYRKAESNATTIQQHDKYIQLWAGSFDANGKLLYSSGVTVADKFTSISSQFTDVEGKIAAKADISTSVQFDPATGYVKSEIKLTADKILIEGITTINDSFKVEEDGTTHIGGFRVSGNGLTNRDDEGEFHNDAYIMFRNDDHDCFAGIGGNILPDSTGVRGVARFENHDTSSWWGLDTNYSMLVSARGAHDNVAIGIDGGCIYGMAMKNTIIGTSVTSQTLKRSDYNVLAINTSECTLTLPEMQLYDDGHVIRIKRLGSGKLKIKMNYCYTWDGTDSRRSYPVMIYNENSTLTGTDTLSVDSVCDSFELVWCRDIARTVDNTTYYGAWVQYKLPRAW